MDSCPFCHSAISEELARFGGTCPKCFADIPGEEAPTDPGAEVRAELEAADRKVYGARRWLPLLVAAPVVGGLLAFAGWLALKPRPVADVLDFDDAAYHLEQLEFVAYAEPDEEQVADEAAPAPRPGAATPAPRERSIRDLKVAVGSGDDDAELDQALEGMADAPAGDEPTGGDAAATRGGVADAQPTTVDGAADGEQTDALQSVQFGLDVGVRRRGQKGVRLTDDSAIIEMIKGVMAQRLPRLKSCYEQQLKVDDDLAGRWVLSFVVGRDGEPRDVAVQGRSASNDSLEGCVADKVRDWEFQPIRADQPVQKTLTFKPGW